MHSFPNDDPDAFPQPVAEAFPVRWALAPPAILAMLAVAIFLGGYNQALFLHANRLLADAASPAIWSAITLSGSVLGALALLAPSLKTRPRLLAAAFLGAPLATLFSEGGKQAFDLMRPAGVLAAESFHLIGQKLYVHSFPSGHATTAGLAAAVIVLAWPEPAGRLRAAIGGLLAATLVILSRIAVGAHWPLDVLVGAAGGWTCGAFGVWLSGRLRFWQRPGGVRVMATIVLSTSLALLFVKLGYPDAHLYQIGLGAWGIGGAAAALMRDRETSS
ncbi:phosphatase PAP2 family protein [Zoogloea sp.]|uniref:phosphatase PAP2 family protein n=1 Tax=Zoogloea sp. TaxID=49181 RepID=UPI00141650B1|nr:MAG: phosphatase PAP2 family protein [Zoogloea sp.]